jgi:hypothetical protein
MKHQVFNDYLKDLPNNSGIGLYFLECSIADCSYNQVSNEFGILRDSRSGYRPYSLSTWTPLTPAQEAELYDDVEKNCFILAEYKLHTKTRTILLNGFNEVKPRTAVK